MSDKSKTPVLDQLRSWGVLEVDVLGGGVVNFSEGAMRHYQKVLNKEEVLQLAAELNALADDL